MKELSSATDKVGSKLPLAFAKLILRTLCEEHSAYRLSFDMVCLNPKRANDPSAGSPTETLLRLLLPLSGKVHQTFHSSVQKLNPAVVRIIHRTTQSVGATGGVYKGQGRNQHELMTRAY